jgi:hypothetical protein
LTLQKSEPTFGFLCRPASNSIEGARERREPEPQQAGAMAAPPKAWKAEYAKSGRASCKSCRSPIAKDQLRLGKMVQASQFDGFMPVRNLSTSSPSTLHLID